jgi:hypothetical protein
MTRRLEHVGDSRYREQGHEERRSHGVPLFDGWE